MNTFRDKTRRLAAKTTIRSGDEIPKRTKVPISGGAVTSFVVGGPKPQTMTTTAITTNGNAWEEVTLPVPGSSYPILLTEKTVGTRLAGMVKSRQLRRHRQTQAPQEVVA